MGLALDQQFYQSTSTGAGNFIAATNFTGGISNIRNFTAPSSAQLVSFGRKGATAGTARLRSNLFHDDVQGIRVRALAGDPSSKIPRWVLQRMFAQDTLTVDGDGTNLEVEAYSTGVFYSDLGGAAARLHSPGDILPLVDLIHGVEVSLAAVAPPAVATSALTSLYNVLKANRDYALLGMLTDNALLCAGIQGQDTSNMVCGFPLEADAFKTRDLFVRMSYETGLPLIPVINAANAPGTNLVIANDIVVAANRVTLILGLLRQNLPI